MNAQNKELLEKFLPIYIPCPPATSPNSSIKIPINWDEANGEVIDALHLIPVGEGIGNHSHKDLNGYAEGYSLLVSNGPNKPFWGPLEAVGNTEVGFDKDSHSIKPDENNPQQVFGAKRNNNRENFAKGKIVMPEILPKSGKMFGYSFVDSSSQKEIKLSTYYANDMWYMLYSLDNIHILVQPNGNEFKTIEYYTSNGQDGLAAARMFLRDQVSKDANCIKAKKLLESPSKND